MIKEQEIWKDIEEYDGDYQISSHGRVRSLKFIKPRILKRTLGDVGYYEVKLSKGKVTTTRIHSLVGKYFVDNPDKKPIINHKDGDKLNNYYKNLEWCTYSENNQHAYDTGLKEGAMIGIKGKDNHRSKPVKDLTTGKVYDSATLASEDLGISRSGICCHCRGERDVQKFEYINNN